MTVSASRTLEALLERHFGAVGTGLHEKVSSVEHNLPAELVTTLRRIASVQDSAVREDHLELKNSERFLEDVDRAMAALSVITAGKVVVPKGVAPSAASGLLSKYSDAIKGGGAVAGIGLAIMVGLHGWDGSAQTEHGVHGSEHAAPPTQLVQPEHAVATTSPASEEKSSSPASPTLEADVTPEEARRPTPMVSDSGGERENLQRTTARGPQRDGMPSVRLGHADVRGSLSKEMLGGVVQRHLSELQLCYEQELNSRPDLSGRAQVKFIISPSGVVQAANVESSTLGAASAENCIAQAVRLWTFPKPRGGGIVIVTYPFLFGPS